MKTDKKSPARKSTSRSFPIEIDAEMLANIKRVALNCGRPWRDVLNEVANQCFRKAWAGLNSVQVQLRAEEVKPSIAFDCPDYLREAFRRVSDEYGLTEADLAAYGFEHVITTIHDEMKEAGIHHDKPFAGEAMKHALKSRPIGGAR